MNFDKRVRVEVPKNWTNDDKGKFFEKLVAELLKKARYRVTQRVYLAGMEIDVLAEHLDSKQKAYVECKFEKTPLQADVLTKALGNALTTGVPLTYVFSTAPPGKGAKGILENERIRNGAPKLSYHGPDSLFDWFQEAKNLELPSIPENTKIISLTLLITPSFYCWVVEEGEFGIPKQAIVFPIENTDKIDFEVIQNLWSGVEVVNVKASSSESNKVMSRHAEEEEIVTSVGMADGFDDYRPCRPQDFIGRKSTQNKVCDFLERVRNKENTTRIICFRGLSGHGKSSIVIKLADEFRKNKNRDKYFLYPIDVRSARSPLFVAKAVRASLQQAVDDHFIGIPGQQVSIGSIGLLLSSNNIQTLLAELENKNRLIIIFFDQFEELFTKESLSSVFDAFNYLALEIDSLKANIVLGFSWRTGLNPPEDHKAFSFWHNLRDKRYELLIEPFTKEEAPQLLNKLSEHIGERLNERLRKRLLNDSQRLPWLLKKLSIHVSHQIKNGVTQLELLSKQFNISSLFDDDLDQLSKSELICLQYIAANSPADTIDVTEKFGNTPDRLMENRLVVKIGQNYTLYWDIFRDYLLSKTIPTVYWKYIPRTQLTVVLKAIELLQNNSMDSTELATRINYQQKSCSNLILDLQNFFLAKREQNDQNLITVQAELRCARPLEIADYLSKQFNEHIIVQKLRETVAVGKKISPENFRKIFELAYPEKKIKSKQTLETYCRRMVQWLVFAGFLERRNKSVIRPLEGGEQKGVIPTEQQEISDYTQLIIFP